VFWLPFLLLYGRQGLDRSILKKALIPTAFNLVMQTCWAGAMYYENPAFMVMLSRTSILWVSLFSLTLFPDERPLIKSPLFWTGATLSLTGLLGVILSNPRFDSAATWTGIALALGASLAWAGYTISVKIVFAHTDSRLSFSIITVYTVLGLSVLAMLFGSPARLLNLPPRQVGYVVISAVTAIALAHVCFYAAIRRIGATIPSMINLLTPFCVLVLSRFFFAERLTGGQWVFGVVLIAGIALAVRARTAVFGPQAAMETPLEE
jgi:drug/metabolite transporter (DMT)-like permease